jgi:signal transduction histidine kinase/DNA-binding NarL/FixJ family response regulator
MEDRSYLPAAYAASLEDGNIGFLLFSPRDGNIVEINRPAAEYLEIGDHDAASLPPVFSVLETVKITVGSRNYHSLRQLFETSRESPAHEGSPGTIRGALRRRPGEPERSFVVRPASDGNKRIWSLMLLPPAETGGTAREDELRRARDLAQESNRSKNEFLANMSHEIRTPLNAILGFAEIIASESADDSMTQYAMTIGRSGRQLLGMLDNILTLAKIEAGRLIVVEDEFSVFSLKKELELSFGPAARKKGLDLTMFADPDLPEYLIADRDKIVRILGRLVDNAIKFTGEGTVSVGLFFAGDDGSDRVRGEAGNGGPKGSLRVVIEDDGIGMKPEDLEDLTALFTQAEQTSSRKYGGTGLGLTISSRMLDLLGGSMDISPRSVKGTKLSVKIPVGISPGPTGSEARAAPEERIREILSGKIVLSVDDTPSNQLLMHRMLDGYGCEVLGAEDGPEGIRIFAERFPDILLMDINMPGMDGWSCLEQIAERFPDEYRSCRIVMLSGDDPDAYLELQRRHGVSAFLTKPYDRHKMSRVLAGLFSGDVSAGGGAAGGPELGEPEQSSDDRPKGGSDEESAGMADPARRQILESTGDSYTKARERMRLQDIISFASLLREASQDYLGSRLYRISTELIAAAERFDIDEIKRLMGDYRRISDEVRQQKDQQEE